MKLFELHRRLKQLDMEALCMEALVENQDQATNMNTDQLWQGQRADGSTLPNYSQRSVAVFGKPAGPIRLFDSGDFYRGFVFASESGAAQFPLVITSTDEKTSELEGRYGEEIFGLNEANLKDLAQAYVLPSLKKKVLAYLHV